MLKGSIVPLITPFRSDHLDIDAFTRLLEWHLSMGTQGVLICGSTGEAAMLTADERRTLISIAVTTLKGKVPIFVGCGTSSTARTLEMMHEAEALGADGTLIIAPYYVKPSQDGIVQHFGALHNKTNLPIIVYNNPGRVGVDITIDTVRRLCDLPRIVGFKDSHSDATRMTAIRHVIGNRLALFSGEDSVIAAHMLYGADGVMSVMANVIPDKIRHLMDVWFSGDIQTFTILTRALHPLNAALCMETNPCTIKYAVSELGHCTPDLRLPLTPIQPNTALCIKNALTKITAKQSAA